MSCSMETKTIFVKIGRNGGKMVEYAVRAGVDLIQVCNQFGIVIQADEQPMLNGVAVNRSAPIVTNVTIMLMKQSKPLNCRVARIGEQLMPVYIQDGDTVNKALIASGRLPFADEEIWLHFDGIVAGKRVLATDKALEGAIYVIEKKNNLRDKVKAVIVRHWDDEIFDDGTDVICTITKEICDMLKADYKMQ